jgi:hypothetical protein
MTTSRGSTYAKVLRKVQFELPKRALTAYQGTALRAVKLMIDRTPVDTGAAKYHWFLRKTAHRPRWSPENTDPSGSAAKSRAREDVLQFKTGQQINILNSAPYFQYLEGGWSQQAPHGIVAITLAEIPSIWKRVALVSFSDTKARVLLQ